MAVLTKLPEQAIIDGFKGCIDYYLWKGLPCVRKWPTWHRRTPWPDELANQQAFAYAAFMWKYLPTGVQQAYREMSQSLPINCKDLFMRSYLAGLKHRQIALP